MEYKLKPISRAGIDQAISKVEHYRFLNEPGEAESICRDILALEPEHQNALRLLGLSITDQFNGSMSDRYGEVAHIFHSLTSEYERSYYNGILHERKAKAQLRAGLPPHTVTSSFEQALSRFEDAERISPANNDDAILRWNRCVRLLQSRMVSEWEKDTEQFDASEGPPV